MTTTNQLIAWLDDDSGIRTVLVEVGVKHGGSEITRYLSNRVYVSETNVEYKPFITGGLDFTESIAVDGEFSVNYGDIELNNFDGTIDSWIDDIWENRSVNVFVGDVTWERSAFVQVFSGIVASLDVRSRTTLNLKIADKLQRLNSTVSEVKVGGTGTNSDTLIPFTIGECHNITPVLTDEANHEYAYHVTTAEGVVEVRDNGIPVSFTNVGNGRIRLNQSPYGTITMSVQGDGSGATYVNTAPDMIVRLATVYGDANKRLSSTDFDMTNIAAMAAAYPHPCGVFLSDKGNVLSVCNDLAKSIGCRLTVTRAGLIKLVRLELPRTTAGTSVSAADMVYHSLKIESIPSVKAAVKLGYAKNYTVQTTLAAGIPEAHLDLYAQEWLSVTRTDSGTTADYKLINDPDQRDTYLLTESAAIIEAENELTLFSTRRKILSYEAFAPLMLEQLGDSQTITHERFGLSAGVAGQIVKVKSDWLKFRVEISVFI